MAGRGPLRMLAGAEPAGTRLRELPARLRSVFTASGWSRKPEPRVRYGQPFLPGLPVLGRQHLEEARPYLERAEALRARRFTYRGHTLSFPGRIDWNPRGESGAWRTALNSLDELPAAGIAAALAALPEGRKGWYDVAAALVKEWIAGAPAGTGPAWDVPALSRRIPNLIQTYVLFAAELRADPRSRRALLESLYAQAATLATAIVGRPSDPWHIAAGHALFMAGRFFDGMEARGWLDAGTTILWGQLREQVEDDGGHHGRNPAVHAFVLGEYLEVLAVLRASNDDVPIWGRKRVKGMADFLLRLLHPDGEIPLFHGATLDEPRPVRELLALAAVVLHESALASPGELPGVWPLLLVGEPGRRAHANLPRRRVSPEPRALRRTGFFILPGEPGDVMIVDGGSPPQDGQPNVFGYELSVGGQRLVVDAGGGMDDDAWHEYAGHRRAHSVLAVEDVQGFALVDTTPVARDVQWGVRDGMMCLSGSDVGFALPAARGLRHRRRIFCLPGRFWLVCDEITGTGIVEATSYVHFHPEVQIRATCQDRPVLTAARSENAWLQMVFAGGHEVRVEGGMTDPETQGWYAPRHGQRVASPTVAVAAATELPLVLGYALLPRTDGPASLTLEHDAFQLWVTVRVGGQEHLITAIQDEIELVSRVV